MSGSSLHHCGLIGEVNQRTRVLCPSVYFLETFLIAIHSAIILVSISHLEESSAELVHFVVCARG